VAEGMKQRIEMENDNELTIGSSGENILGNPSCLAGKRVSEDARDPLSWPYAALSASAGVVFVAINIF
jgi:hypothetical protein